MAKTYKNKLIDFEVPPPSVVWDKISEELQSNKEYLSVSNRLFDYELTPPANTWNLIKQSLTDTYETHPTFSIVAQKRKTKYYIIAAAAMLAVVLTGILYLNKLESKNSVASGNTNSVVKKEPQQNIPAIQSAPELSATEPAVEEINQKQSPPDLKPYKKYTEDETVLENAIVKNSFSPGSQSQIIIAAKPIRNANGEIIQDPEIINNANSRYISITGPNGQQTKISSKFLHMLLFINDDNDIDQVDGYFDKNFLESLVWKSRFKDWRNEIIRTSYIPSTSNFMDILDLKDLLINNK